jgi:hypothetical protein
MRQYFDSSYMEYRILLRFPYWSLHAEIPIRLPEDNQDLHSLDVSGPAFGRCRHCEPGFIGRGNLAPFCHCEPEGRGNPTCKASRPEAAVGGSKDLSYQEEIPRYSWDSA